MKKTVIFIVAFLSIMALKAQYKDLPKVKPVLKNTAASDRNYWDYHALSVEIGSKDIATLNSSTLTSYVDSTINNLKPGKLETELLKKFRKEITQTYTSASADMLFNKSFFPVKCAITEDSALAIVFSGMYSTFVYKENNKNTALEVIVTELLPFIKISAENFKNSDIKYIGIIKTYGIRSAEGKIRSCSIVMLTPVKVSQKFQEGKIRAAELIINSEIYISDNSGFNKIDF